MHYASIKNRFKSEVFISIFVAIFAKNSYDVVQLLWQSEFGGDRQCSEHYVSYKVCILF